MLPVAALAIVLAIVLAIAGLVELAAIRFGMDGLQALFQCRVPASHLQTAPRAICTPAWQERFPSRRGVPVVAASALGVQDIPAGGTPDASSILVQRGRCSIGLRAEIVDETPAGGGAYRMMTIPSLRGMDLSHEEGVTMAADGLTIIGMRDDSLGFRAARRSAVGKVDFAVVANDEFAAIVATAPQVLWAPSISPDGLVFYYSLVNDPDPNVNGIYESVRPATNVPFPPGIRMPAVVQAFAQYVNGLSADHLSLFLELKDGVEGGYATIVLTRASESQPFGNANAPNPPPRVPGLRTRPLGGCSQLIGSCAPLGDGCSGEDVCTWSASSLDF